MLKMLLPEPEAGVETAYCPYCGGKIAVRGQPCCPHCAADIIDIWKLLDSNLQPPSPVRPAPSKPGALDWIAPLLIIGLGLVLFGLLVAGMFFALPWLARLIARLAPSGMSLLKTALWISGQVAGLA